MHDILKNNFPYCEPNYDSKFINKSVIKYIRNFCCSNPFIEEFFAKGSLMHGCMIKGSDIDHVRIKVNKELSLDTKITLVDSLEYGVKELGVTELKRIREDDYIRVFTDWEKLRDIPNAQTRTYELYPKLHILSAKNNQEWLKKILKAGYNYNRNISVDWIERMTERILR